MILVILDNQNTKNEVTKICNGEGIREAKVLLSNLYTVNEGHGRNLEQFMGTQTWQSRAYYSISRVNRHFSMY